MDGKDRREVNPILMSVSIILPVLATNLFHEGMSYLLNYIEMKKLISQTLYAIIFLTIDCSEIIVSTIRFVKVNQNKLKFMDWFLLGSLCERP